MFVIFAPSVKTCFKLFFKYQIEEEIEEAVEWMRYCEEIMTNDNKTNAERRVWMKQSCWKYKPWVFSQAISP